MLRVQLLTFCFYGQPLYNEKMEEEFNEDKSNNLKTFLILLFFLVAIAGLAWFFGWRAKQGDIIKQNAPIIITTTSTP